MISGRTSELKYLNTYYERDDSQIMVVYGGKRVGKTALLRQFVQDKPYCYYKARSASLREQRYQWGKELGIERDKGIRYPDFVQIFRSIIREKTEKKIIIIDEFQYMVKSSDEFTKELIDFVRSKWLDTQVMVILCSSSVGWVENSMITQIGSAAYSLSGLLKVRELGFDAMSKFFPGFSMEQCIEVYAVLGGIPGFWKYFDDKLSVKENICKFILNRDAFLYEEGQKIVEEEPVSYTHLRAHET